MKRKYPLVENTFYHLYNRTNHQFEQMFRSSKDYISFLQRYRKYSEGVLETYSYCLMPNHFHFLIRTTPRVAKQPAGLVLGNLFNSYAKWFNKKYERRGRLFHDRFQAKPVCDEAYLFTLIHYIHQNPVRAGLCKQITDWPFSSYLEFAELRNGTLPKTDLKSDFMISTSEFVTVSNELVQQIRPEYWV